MEYEKPLFFRVMSYASDADHDVIDMVSGNPDWEPPSALRDALHEYADFSPDRFQYAPSEGIHELRNEIANRRQVDPDSIIITNGAGEANYLAMASALDRAAGTEVVLTDPVYPYYPGKTTMLGGEARYVPVAEDGTLTLDAVAEAVGSQTACIVVNTPNNPTGAVYDEETMRGLIDLATDHDAILVSDEVYDHFDHSGHFTSALSIDSPHRIVTNSFSKSLAITGFRVGYGVFPTELIDRARTRHMLVNVTGSRPAQYAVYRTLRETAPDYFAANRRTIQRRIETFTESLADTDAQYLRPVGSFYVMVRFPGLPGTLENVFRLIDEAGVAGMPGEVFGQARAAWFRFALVTPRVDEAATRLERYFR